MDFSQWRTSGASAEAWLRYVASLLALGGLPAAEIRRTIDELMNQGHYADAYLPALDDHASFAEHLVPALRAAMHSFGVDMPDRTGAIRQIIAFHLQAIADGRVDPLAGFRRVLDDVSWQQEFREGSAHFLGDSFGAQKLVGLYYAADDLKDSGFSYHINGQHGAAALDELQRELRDEAVRWLEGDAAACRPATG